MQLDGDNSVGKHYHSQVPACATEAGFPGSAANRTEHLTWNKRVYFGEFISEQQLSALMLITKALCKVTQEHFRS